MDPALGYGLSSGKPVTIIYQDRQGNLTRRKIIPQQLRGQNLLACDCGCRDFRTFRLEGILAAQLELQS